MSSSVLIVEDEVLVALMLEETLTDAGFAGGRGQWSRVNTRNEDRKRSISGSCSSADLKVATST